MPSLNNGAAANLADVQQRVHELKTTAESRELTNAEVAEVSKLEKKDASLRKDLKQQQALDDLVRQLGPMAGAVGPGAPTDRELQKAGDGITRLWSAAARGSTASVDMSPSVMQAKSVSMTGPGQAKDLATSDMGMTPQVQTRVVSGDYSTQPRIGGLFTQQQANGPVERIYRVSQPASAGLVDEGAEKPDADLAVDHVDVELQKIANKLRVTDELVADGARFVETFQADMLAALRAKENEYILDQLADTSGLQTTRAEGVVDAVSTSLAMLETMGITADSVLVSPRDVAELRQTRDTTDRYLLSPVEGGPPSLWGARLVVVPQLSQGDVYVGDFANMGQFLTRDALRIEAGMSSDDFDTNRRTLRAEERVALGAIRPHYVVRATLGAE